MALNIYRAISMFMAITGSYIQPPEYSTQHTPTVAPYGSHHGYHYRTTTDVTPQSTTMRVHHTTSHSPKSHVDHFRQSNKRMVCYYENWTVYRDGKGKFDIEDIDPSLCTHLIYGFAKLENNVIRAFDPWQDLGPNEPGGGKDGYRRFNKLKEVNPKLKTLLAIGGWNAGSELFSTMSSSNETRSTFINSVVSFLKKYNFDGLDMDWEYPAARGGKPEDKENFANLLKEMRQKFTPEKLMVTAAVSPNQVISKDAYDIATLNENLDFVSVMCYDYHGAFDKYTGHNSPLYFIKEDSNYEPTFNVNSTITWWISQGLSKDKINLGMPMYGRGVTLDDPNKHGLYQPAQNPIPAGPYTKTPGFWAYNEICERFEKDGNSWTTVVVPQIEAPYSYKDSLWIGYDTPESVATKAKYLLDLDLGGAMAWAIDDDDFKGYCGNGKFPMLTSIVKALNGGHIHTTTTPSTTTTHETTTTVPTTTNMTTTTPTTTTNATTTTSTTTTIRPDTHKCTENGQLIPDPENCNKYFECQKLEGDFKKVPMPCPKGLAFNVKIQTCDYPQNVPGCEDCCKEDKQ